jgi:hypothetical protein
LRTLLRAELYTEDGLTASTPLKLMNRVIDVRPLVCLAAKLVGSGPSRLRMVRLSHELNNDRAHFDVMAPRS